MSEYFGALKVDQLNEEDEPDHKINCKMEVFKSYYRAVRGVLRCEASRKYHIDYSR
jgi:hypothetical protein